MKSIMMLLFLFVNLIFAALIKQPQQIKFSRTSSDVNYPNTFLINDDDRSEFRVLIKSAHKHEWNYKYKKESRLVISTQQTDKLTQYKYEEFSPRCIGAKFMNPYDLNKCVNSVEYIEKKSVCPVNYILVGYGNCIKKNDCPIGMIPSPVIYPVPCIPILRSNEHYTCGPGEIQIGGKECFNPRKCEKGKMPSPFRWKTNCIDMPNVIKAWTKKDIQKLTKIKLSK